MLDMGAVPIRVAQDTVGLNTGAVPSCTPCLDWGLKTAPSIHEGLGMVTRKDFQR